MSRGLHRSEEWLAERELRLKAQNKQKDIHLAGDKPKRPTKRKEPVLTEHQEQCAVIQWCDAHPIAKHIFAIPNGSHKSPAMAAKFKREGLRSGVPDLFLPVVRSEFHGLFIEMKRTKRSNTSEAQCDWIGRLQVNGYAVAICLGAEDAILRISRYLDNEPIYTEAEFYGI